jgi:dTMP kinase
MAGRLIVFESIDGGGTETQSKLLLEYLKKKGIPAERLTYPDYEQPLGRLIHEYLHKKFEFSNETLVLLHLADRNKDKQKIREWLDEGKIVIADRYITTTIAYQGFAGFPIEKIIQLADMFELPKPEAIVFLKISADTSMERKQKEKPELDRNEENKELMKDMGKFYEKLINERVYSKWFVVDGEKTRQEVFEQVRKVLDI